MDDARQPARPTFGTLAVVLGCLAFAGVVGHFFTGPIDPPPPLEVSLAEKAVNIRDATVAALKGEAYEARAAEVSRTLDDYMSSGFVALAVSAIVMAVIGFVRHERVRPLVAGAGLGTLAITFQFMVVVFFAVLGALLLSAFIDKLDFDF